MRRFDYSLERSFKLRKGYGMGSVQIRKRPKFVFATLCIARMLVGLLFVNRHISHLETVTVVFGGGVFPRWRKTTGVHRLIDMDVIHLGISA